MNESTANQTRSEREKREVVLAKDHKKMDWAWETASTVCLAFMKVLDSLSGAAGGMDGGVERGTEFPLKSIYSGGYLLN